MINVLTTSPSGYTSCIFIVISATTPAALVTSSIMVRIARANLDRFLYLQSTLASTHTVIHASS